MRPEEKDVPARMIVVLALAIIATACENSGRPSRRSRIAEASWHRRVFGQARIQ
jgi:hypothetical protein